MNDLALNFVGYQLILSSLENVLCNDKGTQWGAYFQHTLTIIVNYQDNLKTYEWISTHIMMLCGSPKLNICKHNTSKNSMLTLRVLNF